MTEIQRQREAFENLLRENPYAEVVHKAFADWLDENCDEPERSAWERFWTRERQEAEDWLRAAAGECGDFCIDYYKLSEEEESTYCPITYEMLLQAGHDYLDRGDYFVQLGSDQARSFFSEAGNTEKFWDCFEKVTGRSWREMKEKESWQEPGECPFSCSC